MSELQRDHFIHDEVFGGEYGIVQIGDQRFEGHITGRRDEDKAWAVAERIFDFLKARFAEIEHRLRAILVPLSGVDRHLGVEPEEAVRQIIEAMRGTESRSLRSMTGDTAPCTTTRCPPRAPNASRCYLMSSEKFSRSAIRRYRTLGRTRQASCNGTITTLPTFKPVLFTVPFLEVENIA